MGNGIRVRVVAALLMAGMLGAGLQVQAQEQGMEERTRAWLGVGLAQGVSSEVEGGLGAVVQLAYQKGPHHFAARALGLADFHGFPDSGGGGLGELGLVYGRRRTASFGYAALSAGAAFVTLDHCPGRGSATCNTVGFPLTAEAALQGGLIGLGLQLYANVNPRSPYGGLTLSLLMGWMP